MRIEFNYKVENFFQVFPLFYVTNGNEKVVLIGLGNTNIAFVFGSNVKTIYDKTDKKSDGIVKDFTFIWYKKLQNSNTTHYTEPFKTTIKAKNREEAVEVLTQFALKKMTLCIHDEENFRKSDYMKVQSSFYQMNKAMADMEKEINNVFNRKF